MGSLEKLKEEYDNIVIPKELDMRIQQEIQKLKEFLDDKTSSGNK